MTQLTRYFAPKLNCRFKVIMYANQLCLELLKIRKMSKSPTGVSKGQKYLMGVSLMWFIDYEYR